MLYIDTSTSKILVAGFERHIKVRCGRYEW